MLSSLTLGLEHGFDFAACVAKIISVHDVADGRLDMDAVMNVIEFISDYF